MSADASDGVTLAAPGNPACPAATRGGAGSGQQSSDDPAARELVDITVVDTAHSKPLPAPPAGSAPGYELHDTTVRELRDVLAGNGGPAQAWFRATDVPEHRIIDACHGADGIFVLSARLCRDFNA